MNMLVFKLNEKHNFNKKMRELCPNLKQIIINDHTIKGEGEFKIVKYINNNIGLFRDYYRKIKCGVLERAGCNP